MTVDDLVKHLQAHWGSIRASLIAGTYRPQALRRVAIPKRGISCVLAWNTAKSVHGPWRLSQSPALTIALPAPHFAALELPNLVEVQTGR